MSWEDPFCSIEDPGLFPCVSLPPRVSIPDTSEPEDRAVSERRREGLWVVRDMPEGQLLVIDAPLPGVLP